ncbi:MAG: YkgJ family cysteine cluster protein [Sandaracinus sp.]
MRTRAPKPAPSSRTLDAGALGEWMVALREALAGERDADVPCGRCTGCCTSSQFVLVAPDETRALAVIPPELLFRAPGLPRGHRLLGYDERGHCPMLEDGRCRIYADRPRTCRTYDCRVLSVASLVDRARPAITRQVKRWRFRMGPEERKAMRAVRRAARFLEAHASTIAEVPSHPSQRAVMAIALHERFLGGEPTLDEVRTFARRLRRSRRG